MTIYKNNFDTSSTGINIEFTGCYDSFISTIDWQENFEPIKFIKDVYFYTACGQLNFDDIAFKIKGTINEKRKYIRDNHHSIKLKANEVEHEILSCIDSDLVALYCDKHDIFEGYKLEIVPSTPLTPVTVRGYSQGDRATVYYAPSMLKKLWGKEPIESELDKDFNHYFCDSPVSACITINGVDYPYDLDSYDWQRTEWLGSVSLASSVDISILETLIPTELDYV